MALLSYPMKPTLLNLIIKNLIRERLVPAAESGERTSQGESQDHLWHSPATDVLTGLVNHRRLSEILESEIKRSERTARAFAVLIFDVDGMKRINDTHGHRGGDRALCRLADIVQLSCRSIDTVARYSGDKFAIILPATCGKEAEAVRRRICERLASDCEEPMLSVRAGFAVYPDDGKTTGTLFQAADRAISNLKKSGKTT